MLKQASACTPFVVANPPTLQGQNYGVEDYDSSDEEESLLNTTDQEESTDNIDIQTTRQNEPLPVFYKRVKWWFILNCSVTMVWLTCFCFAITYYVLFPKRCTDSNVFGTFGLCLAAYLFLRYMFATFVTGVAWYRLRKMGISHMITTPDLKQAYTARILNMNNSMAFRNDIRDTLMKTMENTQEIIPGEIQRDRGNTVFRFPPQIIQQMDTQCENETYSFKTQYWRVYMMCMVEVVPMFSIIFYIIAGAEAPSFDPRIPGSNICDASHTFNWVLLSICLLHNSICLLPLTIRLLTKGYFPSLFSDTFQVNDNK